MNYELILYYHFFLLLLPPALASCFFCLLHNVFCLISHVLYLFLAYCFLCLMHTALCLISYILSLFLTYCPCLLFHCLLPFVSHLMSLFFTLHHPAYTEYNPQREACKEQGRPSHTYQRQGQPRDGAQPHRHAHIHHCLQHQRET